MQINGQEVTKDGLNIKIDGRPLYLGRDGVSVVDSTSTVIVTLAAGQVAALRAEEAAIRAARQAAPKSWAGARGARPNASRVSKERAYDRGYNEGGEGYNPYRHGSAKSYR
ncbi:MAG TPA: hypothetical protein VMS01_04075 [Stellaceae bacterium]|nr:hypothetical protein [Stellaceae bacterium]